MIRMWFPDGSELRAARGISLREAAMTIHPDLADRAVCASVDGELRDLRDTLAEDCQLTLHTDATPEGARVAGHTAAHIVAQAVKRLFPSAILGLDPTANGFFSCDVEFGRSLTEDDLQRIQEEVDRIVTEDLPIEREILSKGDARALLIRRGEVLKLEILERIGSPTVTVYRHGEFVDLCRGPHLASTGRLPEIRLTAVGEASWRNDPNAEALSRISGAVVPSRPA